MPHLSRYTGEPLSADEIVLSLIVSGNDLFGHSHIAFEWDDGQHRHEVYHLYPLPSAEERARGLENSNVIELVLSGNATREGHVEKSTDLDFFPRENKQGEPLTAWFKSWRVPFAAGWKAREAAEAGLREPPTFQVFQWSGRNCSRWCIDLAALAGVHAETLVSEWLAAVPRELVKDGEAVPPR